MYFERKGIIGHGTSRFDFVFYLIFLNFYVGQFKVI